jgi:murein DD-endopeptidase MepM/ murein hydrolase activator NlpD
VAQHRSSGNTGGRHRVIAPPSKKVVWLTASVAGAAVAAFGSGAPTAASVESSSDLAALKSVSAARSRREAMRPRWVRPGTGYLSSCFCARWGTFHYGIDLAAPYGSPIYAAGDGVVIEAGPASGFGQWVVVEHSNGDVSIYGHEYKILVHKGERVQAGQLIALVGSEGESTGPHLHFEVHMGGLEGTRIDPIPWLAERGVKI